MRLRRLERLPNYVRRFGILEGIRLFWAIEKTLPVKSQRVRTVRVPGLPFPISLRDSLPDHATFWQVMVQAQYDLESFPQTERLMQVYREILHRGKRPIIVDAGGNIGLSAVWFAHRFPDARIQVIEPDARNFEILLRNTEAFANVVGIKGGLWGEKSRLKIANPDSGSAAFHTTEAEPGSSEWIESFTVDELLAREAGGELFLVKLDIEGAQRRLFDAGCDWVGQCHLIVMELDDWQMPWQATSRGFFACTSRYDYDYLLNGENIVCFRHADPAANWDGGPDHDRG